jgi:preprotein translocase subunit SecF
MTAAGAGIVLLSVLIGLFVGAREGLDGLQTALCVALAWIVASSLYHAAMVCRPRRGRRR